MKPLDLTVTEALMKEKEAQLAFDSYAIRQDLLSQGL